MIARLPLHLATKIEPESKARCRDILIHYLDSFTVLYVFSFFHIQHGNRIQTQYARNPVPVQIYLSSTVFASNFYHFCFMVLHLLIQVFEFEVGWI
ncbi:hypothetical protein BKA65DRAFT_37647 [Rhexocercosporidium sp. MPI-PUGE-AT-0058]|nr:hypothetical protein BKA65DRAFT_37647 [Rhexocercosporidium sp. MPI-PUGE-AT-0058]